MMRHLSLVLLLPSLVLPGQGRAQQPERDAGKLVVRQGGVIVGEEEFSVERVSGGINLIVTASYPPAVPNRLAASFGPRRITVRLASNGTEVAREYPGGAQTIVVAEHALSLYAVAGGLAPGPVTIQGAGSPSRRSGTLEDRGREPLPQLDGSLARRVTLRAGEEVIELWYDSAGRLVRIAIPAKDLTAERAAR
jgi:hypothetical protein